MFHLIYFSFQVYDTCDVEQVCIQRNDKVCLDVTDLQCNVVAYTGTNQAQANKKEICILIDVAVTLSEPMYLT